MENCEALFAFSRIVVVLLFFEKLDLLCQQLNHLVLGLELFCQRVNPLVLRLELLCNQVIFGIKVHLE